MALDISVQGVKLTYLTITAVGDVDNTITLNADWLPLDSNDQPIAFIGQRKDGESQPFTNYPQNVRDAILVLNAYAIGRISTAYGIE